MVSAIISGSSSALAWDTVLCSSEGKTIITYTVPTMYMYIMYILTFSLFSFLAFFLNNTKS